MGAPTGLSLLVSSQLARFLDLDGCIGLVSGSWGTFDLLYDFKALRDLTEDAVFAVKPRGTSLLRDDEELRAWNGEYQYERGSDR